MRYLTWKHVALAGIVALVLLGMFAAVGAGSCCEGLLMSSTVPASFDIETATQDFAGPGREIDCPHRAEGEVESGLSERPFARRQMLLKVNGWTFSAVWGLGTYSTAGRGSGWPQTFPSEAPSSSPDAEIACWQGDGPMIELHGDTVEGWVSPVSLLAAVAAAERDDQDGIRAALVRRED